MINDHGHFAAPPQKFKNYAEEPNNAFPAEANGGQRLPIHIRIAAENLHEHRVLGEFWHCLLDASSLLRVQRDAITFAVDDDGAETGCRKKRRQESGARRDERDNGGVKPISERLTSLVPRQEAASTSWRQCVHLRTGSQRSA